LIILPTKIHHINAAISNVGRPEYNMT